MISLSQDLPDMLYLMAGEEGGGEQHTQSYRRNIVPVVIWEGDVRGLRVYTSFSEVLLSEKRNNLPFIFSLHGAGCYEG